MKQSEKRNEKMDSSKKILFKNLKNGIIGSLESVQQYDEKSDYDINEVINGFYDYINDNTINMLKNTVLNEREEKLLKKVYEAMERVSNSTPMIIQADIRNEEYWKELLDVAYECLIELKKVKNEMSNR